MHVNFFEERCKSESNSRYFGICDDPEAARTPAYLDEDELNNQNWIGKVSNSSSETIEFFAIDNCVKLLRPGGEIQNRCDGLLRFDNKLIFVELKSGKHGWLGKGRKQLTQTINRFKEEYNISSFNKVKAYLCNNMRPRATSNHKIEIQKFKDETGLILRVEQEIRIT